MKLRLVCFTMILSSATAAFGQPANVVTEEAMVKSSDPGIEIYVREKHAEGISSFSADRTLLFIHGATYPAETAFDLPIEGVSMMDLFAENGYDVYLVDVRGYGWANPTAPQEMTQPAGTATNRSCAHRRRGQGRRRRGRFHSQAARRDEDQFDGLVLGHEHHGMVYDSKNNDKVNKLVLYAPLWIFNRPARLDPGNKLGAYRTVTREAANARWLTGVPESKKAALIPVGWFDALGGRNVCERPRGASKNGGSSRAERRDCRRPRLLERRQAHV